MRPKEDTRRGEPRLEQPFPVSPKVDFVDRVIHHAGYNFGEVSGTTPQVKINDVVQTGPKAARAIALLGIDAETIDDHWYNFVHFVCVEEERTNPARPGIAWLKQHQENMGWRVDVKIPDDVIANEELVYIDEGIGERWVTLRCKRWRRASGVLPGFTDEPIPPDATWELEERRLDLDGLGAVGAAWFGITEEQHDATIDAWADLDTAWHHLLKALDEIELAGKIADKAWDGPRSEAAKYKFWQEYEMIEAITRVTEHWGSYLWQLGRTQGQQIREQKALLSAIVTEMGIEVATTLLTWGAGAVLTVPRTLCRISSILSKAFEVRKASGKIKTFVKALEEARDFQRKLRKEKAVERAKNLRWYHTLAGIASAGVIDGSKDFAAKAVVERGRRGEWTLDNWWKSFVFAGAIGGSGGKSAQAMRDFAERRHIDIGDAAYGLTKEGAKGGVAAGAKEGLTNDPLVGGVLTAPLAGAIKEPAIAKIKADLKASGLSDEAAEKIATKVADLPINAAKAGAAKGIDEYRKQQGETSDLPTPGDGIISKPRVSR